MAHAALEPGGHLLIRDIVLEADRTTPPWGALFAVNLLVNTPNGDCFTFDELKQDLKAAGFTEPMLINKTDGMNSVLAARKTK